MVMVKRILLWFLSLLLGLLFPVSRDTPDRLSEKQILYNSLPHPYLAGYYSPDGSEITITGLKVLDEYYDGERLFPFIEHVDIPNEIDGIPVTAIEREAFLFSEDKILLEDGQHISTGSSVWLRGSPVQSITIGNNVRSVGKWAFEGIPTLIIGKNVSFWEGGFVELNNCLTVYCYEDSYIGDLYRLYAIDWPVEFQELDTWFCFIDESHLISEEATIDEDLFVRGLPQGLTAQTLTDHVSVDGDALLRVQGDTISTGTKIELVNSTYGTIDNIYTVVNEGDLDGDGAFYSADDYALLHSFAAGLGAPQENPAAYAAADLNRDGLVNSTDLTCMRVHAAN